MSYLTKPHKKIQIIMKTFGNYTEFKLNWFQNVLVKAKDY